MITRKNLYRYVLTKWGLLGVLVIFCLFANACSAGASLTPITPLPLVTPLTHQDLAAMTCQLADFPFAEGAPWHEGDSLKEIPRLAASPDLIEQYLGNTFYKRGSERLQFAACHVYVYESPLTAQAAFQDLEDCSTSSLKSFIVHLGEENCGRVGQLPAISTSAYLAFRYQQVIISIQTDGDSTITVREAQSLTERLAEHVYERLLSYTVAP